MIDEKLYNRKILEAFIQKQIYRCVTNERYVFGILISDDFKYKLINEIVSQCLEREFNIYIRHYYKNKFDGTLIEFNNGSLIKIQTCIENRRGNRYNALVIDSNIDNGLKDNICYPKVVPYPALSHLSFDISKQINNRSDVIEIDIR